MKSLFHKDQPLNITGITHPYARITAECALQIWTVSAFVNASLIKQNNCCPLISSPGFIWSGHASGDSVFRASVPSSCLPQFYGPVSVTTSGLVQFRFSYRNFTPVKSACRFLEDEYQQGKRVVNNYTLLILNKYV